MEYKDGFLEKEIIKRWNNIEPKLRIGDEINKKLYNELIWLDFFISIFHSKLIEGENDG